jgi:AraC-like DNA-binding protein
MIDAEFLKNIDFSFSALSALIGTIFGLYLVLKQKELNYLNILLGFILIISARFIAFSPIFKSNYTIYLENALITRPWYFLIPPALYFYVSFRLGYKFSWKKKDLLHLFPFILFFLDFLVFNFSSSTHKNNIYIGINDDFTTEFNSKVGFLSSSIFYFSILIQWNVYQLIFIRYFFQHLFFIKDIFLNWSLYLIFAMSLIIFSIEIRAFYLIASSTYGPPVLKSFFLTLNKSFALIVFNSLWIVYLYRFVFTSKNEDNKNVSFETIKNGLSSESKKEKEIHFEDFMAIKIKLDSFFATSSLYLDSSFNINRLALEIGVSSNVLTRYFNQFLGMRYNHAINKVRIEKLVKMHEEDNAVFENITMEAIGNSVGFSSKSSFYAAFSKVMLCTPSEYFIKKQIPTH